MTHLAWPPADMPLDVVDTPWLRDAGVQLAILRLDQLDPRVSGNKLFKLQHVLSQARKPGIRGLISLGGAHSNHLHALAAACQERGLQSVGLLRGEAQETATVADLQAMGMHLHWLGYGGYRQRHQPGFWQPWQQRYPGFLCVAEGGQDEQAAQDCRLLPAMALRQARAQGWARIDQLWVAVGTGTTLAGVLMGAWPGLEVVGCLAVPPSHLNQALLQGWLHKQGLSWRGEGLLDASRGGFARSDSLLLQSIIDFEDETGIALEPLYTGKMLLALRQRVERGGIPPGSRLVAVHSGGLQGRRSFVESGRLPAR